MTKQTKGTYHLISLGCPKNLVDSESMAELLNRQGMNPVGQPEDAEFLIVNTCGFLQAARDRRADRPCQRENALAKTDRGGLHDRTPPPGDHRQRTRN